MPRKGIYVKYTPFRCNFDLAPNLTPSNNKLFAVIRGHLLPLTNWCGDKGVGKMRKIGKIGKMGRMRVW